MSKKSVFLLILIYFLIVNRFVFAQTNVFEDKKKIEKARNFMIELYSKKIQDHILMIFTIFGGWFTISKKIDENKENRPDSRTHRIYVAILFTIGIYFLLYSVGRLIYWSQFNSILLKIKPIPSGRKYEGYLENLKWGFHIGIANRINGIDPFDDFSDYPRYFFLKIAYLMSGHRLVNMRRYIMPMISVILSKVYYHRSRIINRIDDKIFRRIDVLIEKIKDT